MRHDPDGVREPDARAARRSISKDATGRAGEAIRPATGRPALRPDPAAAASPAAAPAATGIVTPDRAAAVDRLLPATGDLVAPWPSGPAAPGASVADGMAATGGAAARSRPGRRASGRTRKAAWIATTLLSVGVALVSYRYVLHVGPVPANIAANRFVRPWIVLHAGGAATALLLGPLQLLPQIRRRRPALHRWLGRAYVAGCAAGSLGGIILAAGTSAGPVAAAGFATLDLCWVVTTTLGTVAAVTGRHAAHRRWMIRSIALTLGAVTLRLYVPLSQLLGIDFLVAYRAISWLAWVPNALLAELHLRRARPGA